MARLATGVDPLRSMLREPSPRCPVSGAPVDCQGPRALLRLHALSQPPNSTATPMMRPRVGNDGEPGSPRPRAASPIRGENAKTIGTPRVVRDCSHEQQPPRRCSPERNRHTSFTETSPREPHQRPGSVRPASRQQPTRDCPRTKVRPTDPCNPHVKDEHPVFIRLPSPPRSDGGPSASRRSTHFGERGRGWRGLLAPA